MNYVKILTLPAIAAAAMVAFAGSASADYVSTTTGGAAATPTIHAVSSGFHVKLANSIANIECSSTAEGKVESHGAGISASGNLSTLSFTGCTNSWHVTTASPGSLRIDASVNHGAFLFSTGTRIEATRFGIKCVYETFNTPIGTMSGGNPAFMNINGLIPLRPFESSALCGTGSSHWTGTYETTSALYVAHS